MSVILFWLSLPLSASYLFWLLLLLGLLLVYDSAGAITEGLSASYLLGGIATIMGYLHFTATVIPVIIFSL